MFSLIQGGPSGENMTNGEAEGGMDAYIPVRVALVLHPKYGEDVPKVQHHQTQSNDRNYLLHAKILKDSKPLIQQQHAYGHHSI